MSASRHIERVKHLPCSVCGEGGPSDYHHILEGRTPGRRSPDWTGIPLCKSCHQGRGGIHGDRTLWNVFKASELGCLAATLEKLYGGVK